MAKAKQQVYCNFIQYIKDNHSEFRDVATRTCSRTAFKPPSGKGIEGITILVPDNKPLKDEIDEHLYGVQLDDLQTAAAIVKSCILHAYLPTAADFNTQKEDIPASNGNKIHVEKIDGDSVILAGGAKIVPDKNFRTADQGNGKKVAIWLIKSGKPVVSTEPSKYTFGSLRKNGSYAGGNPYSSGLSQSQLIRNINRASYLRTILFAYHVANVCAKNGSNTYRLPLLEYSASLIGFIAEKYPEYLPDAMSVCNVGLSDIVFLLEPDCSIDPLIPDKIIDEWWDNRKTHPILETYQRAFKSVEGAAACFGKRDELTRAFNAYRENNPADINTFGNLTKLYATLSESNAIFGISNIFPGRVADRYKMYPALKMVEDDRRCCFENCLMDYELVANGGEVDLSQAASLFCAFNAEKGGLGFGAMLVMNSTKAFNKAVTNVVDTFIAPIYHSNLALYMPGMSPLPNHVSDPHKASPNDFIDLNVYNVTVVSKVYGSQPENITVLDRMALHCYNASMKGMIQIPSL